MGGALGEPQLRALAGGGVAVRLLVTLFAGLSMVVQIPFWSFKEINVRRKVPFVAMIAAMLVLLVVAMEPR